jgi:hypothetical protein
MFVFCAYVAPFVMLLHLGYCMAFYIAFFFLGLLAFSKWASKVFWYYILGALLFFFFTYCVLEVLEYLFVNYMEVNQPPKKGDEDDHPSIPLHQIDCSKFQGSLTTYKTYTDRIEHSLNPVLLEFDSTTSGNAYSKLTFTKNTPKYGPLTFTLTIPENVTSERTITIRDKSNNTVTLTLPIPENVTSEITITIRDNSNKTVTITLPNISTRISASTSSNMLKVDCSFINNGNNSTTMTLSVPGREPVSSTFREISDRKRTTIVNWLKNVYIYEKPVHNKHLYQEECPVDNKYLFEDPETRKRDSDNLDEIVRCRGTGGRIKVDSLSFRFNSQKYKYSNTDLEYIRPFVMSFHYNVAEKGNYSVHTLDRFMNDIVQAETDRLVKQKHSVADADALRIRKQHLDFFEKSIRQAIIDLHKK